MYNGIINMESKEGIVKKFKEIIKDVEERITEDNKEEINKKLDILKKLTNDIESATSTDELNNVMGNFLKKNKRFTIEIADVHFTLFTTEDGEDENRLMDSEFADSLMNLSISYAKNFLSHLEKYEVSLGVTEEENLTEIGTMEKTMIIKDGDNIMALDKLLEVYAKAFKYAVKELARKKFEKKKKLLEEDAKNNLKI